MNAANLYHVFRHVTNTYIYIRIYIYIYIYLYTYIYLYIYIRIYIRIILIQVLNAVYSLVAIQLTEYENHRTDTEYEDFLIGKTFVFQFINR
jgi:hypothetical protein